ncbi:PAS domain S-box protein [Halovenus rubra]|uniref:PAS domain S-box protein n=2 Tax=Halovenus rubra TaxID=869890 RepID=A0ACC7E033_9EURY|nr:PAS domain S-box protein [Halovenus rubra]
MLGNDSIRILHVDDNISFTEIVAEFLEREGNDFVVETATNTDEGLERIKTETYDCVVSDYEMPGENGIRFLETVRDIYSDLPFILYTGKGDEAVASEAISAGVTDYLQKGTGTKQYKLLANRIENAVAQFRTNHRATKIQRRLQELSEVTHDVLWMAKADWSEMLFVNSAYEDIWGRSKEMLLDDPLDFMQGVHPDDKTQVTTSIERASEGKPVDFEFRVNADEDFRRWIWMQAEPICNDAGEPVRIAGFARDITERKQQRERFQAFIEQSTDVISVLNPDGTYQYQSPSSKRVLGYEPDELIGETSFNYVHPEDKEQLLATFSEGVNNPETTPIAEYRFKHKDGSWRWIESVGYNQLDNPAIEGGVVNSRDITERKQKEQKLQQTRKRMEFALNATDAVIWDWNVDAEQITFYPTEEELFGTAIETGSDLLGVAHPDDEQQIRDAVEHSLETGNPEDMEVRIRHGDSIRWIKSQGKPIHDDETTRMIGLARDVTDRKQREQRLERQNERMEKFVNIVSHDLRNPLNVAGLRLDMARQECDSEYLDDIDHALYRMEQLITNLLSLARKGQQVQEKELVEVATIAKRSWKSVATPNATLVTETEHTVEGDPSRLEQLFENLFRNAIEHAGDEVEITVTAVDGAVGFAVADDGPGIPEADREQIFNPGFSTAEDGTGFGLTIIQEIAEAHGWTCRVNQSDDGGARFEFLTQL